MYYLKNPFYIGCVLLPALLTLGACSKGKPDAEPGPGSARAAAVLAKVNDTPITEKELEYALGRLSDGRLASISEEVSQKVLHSLVASRAMAVLAERDLTVAEKDLLDVKVQAYREELLVKEYLQRHADPQPVTNTMVNQYYQDHPQEFGGDSVKGFEFVTTYGPLDDDQRKQVLHHLQNVPAASDLASVTQQLQQQNLPVRHKKAEMRMALLESPLKELVEATAKGQRAPLHNKDEIILLQVNTERTTPPKPLAEVGAEIRKKLSPLQVKQAIKELSDAVKEQVDIEYLDER